MSDLRIIVEPSVYVLGRQRVDEAELARFLADYDLSGWATDAATAGEGLVEVAARGCYWSFSNPRPGGNAAFVGHILDVQHGSVIEHATWTLFITGVSRSLTHELVRHRVGISPSMLSQRYVDSSDVAFVVPPALMGSMGASDVAGRLRASAKAGDQAAWDAALAEARRARPGDGPAQACDRARPFERWMHSCAVALETYSELADDLEAESANLPDKTLRRKKAREAARSVLPNCAETKIAITANARAMRWLIEQRGSVHADAEFARLAVTLLRIFKVEAPNLFADMDVKIDESGREFVTVVHSKV